MSRLAWVVVGAQHTAPQIGTISARRPLGSAGASCHPIIPSGELVIPSLSAQAGEARNPLFG